MELRTVEIDSLRPHPKNPRIHPDSSLAKLERSISEFGFTNPVLATKDGLILAGHGRVMAVRKLGIQTIPVIFLDMDGAKADAYVVADNYLGELSQWDEDLLRGVLEELEASEIDGTLTGLSVQEIEALIEGTAHIATADIIWAEVIAPDVEAQEDEFDVDAALAETTEPVTKPGDVWILGRHRLACGDCTDPKVRDAAMGGVTMELILTDPPYCSGGFQEAQRGSGSIGTSLKAAPKIINDALSTRGYIALIRSALSGFPVVAAYVFTDWRMWVNLYDVMESCGYPVRNMIVWDKQSPGMGRGWRTQHELVMFAVKGNLEIDNHKAVGNVVQCKRTGNVDHPTQKPVELLGILMGVPDLAEVYDPFAGSGSTLIACEQTGRNFYGVELDPIFCDVAVRRWEEYTGEKAERMAVYGASV